ncbi:MAG: retroviral-like aspartic protease [Phycisphaerae bacterium]|nr:retropepsin-like domain-containing protein [Phycisphaerae bacterium]NUQ46551.1 retroviral-like aspartic protease [Phycisphaerae bacterium]
MNRSVIEPKPGVEMGRVDVTITVENVEDRERAERGEIPPEQVRRVTTEALVDSGATYLCMPEAMVRTLGLKFHRMRESRTVSGPMTLGVYRGAQIEVQDRTVTDEVSAFPEGCQVLLGQIPLEKLDFWIDVVNHRLVGNPEHGGQWMAEVF